MKIPNDGAWTILLERWIEVIGRAPDAEADLLVLMEAANRLAVGWRVWFEAGSEPDKPGVYASPPSPTAEEKISAALSMTIDLYVAFRAAHVGVPSQAIEQDFTELAKAEWNAANGFPNR